MWYRRDIDVMKCRWTLSPVLKFLFFLLQVNVFKSEFHFMRMWHGAPDIKINDLLVYDRLIGRGIKFDLLFAMYTSTVEQFITTEIAYYIWSGKFCRNLTPHFSIRVIVCAIHIWLISSSLILFVWGFSSHSRIFHSYGDVIITSEELQVLNCTRRSWLLSNQGFL